MSLSDSKVQKNQSAAFSPTLLEAVLPIGSWPDAKSDSFLERNILIPFGLSRTNCNMRPPNRPRFI
jgi:hypothetical protein